MKQNCGLLKRSAGVLVSPADEGDFDIAAGAQRQCNNAERSRERTPISSTAVEKTPLSLVLYLAVAGRVDRH